MAHSDIFLCGQSSDAMLATGVYSVIKEKKGVVKCFFLERLSRKHPHTLGRFYNAVARPAKTNGAVGLHQEEKNVFNLSQEWTTIDCRKQTQISEEIRKAALLLPFHLALFFYPLTPLFLPGPGKAISRSHT